MKFSTVTRAHKDKERGRGSMVMFSPDDNIL